LLESSSQADANEKVKKTAAQIRDAGAGVPICAIRCIEEVGCQNTGAENDRKRQTRLRLYRRRILHTKPLHEQSTEDFDKLMSINVRLFVHEIEIQQMLTSDQA